MVNPTGHGNLTAQMDACQYSIWKNDDIEMSRYGIEDQKETHWRPSQYGRKVQKDKSRKEKATCVGKHTHNEVVALPSSITRSPTIGANQSFSRIPQ